ncbi:MAG: hypothetical protein Q8M83_00900 [bacterium]|nr:hypothetical protein [bacterium]
MDKKIIEGLFTERIAAISRELTNNLFLSAAQRQEKEEELKKIVEQRKRAAAFFENK